MNTFEKRVYGLFVILMVMAGGAFVYSQTPPGPNTIEHGQGINSPTITATDGYFYGATNVTGSLFGDFGLNDIYTLGSIGGTTYQVGATDVTDHLTASLVESASYIVYPDGGNYYAKNGVTGQPEFSGANATTVLQAVFSLGGKVFIKNGIYPCQKLSLPSNIVIQFESRDTVLKIPDGVNANTYMFTNSDPANGNTGIILVDGTLEGAEENQTAGSMYGLSFTNVTESYVSMWIQGFRSYDAHLDNCKVELENRWYGDKWNAPILLYGGFATRGTVGGFNLNVTIPGGIDLRNKYITFMIDDFSSSRRIDTNSPGYTKLQWGAFTNAGTHFSVGYTDGDYVTAAQCYDTTSENNNVPKLKNVTSINIYGWDNDQYQVGEIWARPLPSEGLWTFCFDDGGGGNFNTFAPVLAKNNYRGQLFYISGYGTSITVLENMYRGYGWEISSHSYTHVRFNNSMTTTEFLHELYDSKTYLQDRGFSKGSEFFGYPYNAGGGWIVFETVRKIYTDGRPIMGYSQEFNQLTPWIRNAVSGTRDQSLFRAAKWHTWEFATRHPSDTEASIISDCEKVSAVGVVKVVTMSEIYNQYQPSSKERIGFVLSNISSDTILNGTTSIVINHGLGYTPTSGNTAWTVSYLENPTNDPGSWYIDTFTATQATIHVLRDPGVSNLNISWSARRTP